MEKQSDFVLSETRTPSGKHYTLNGVPCLNSHAEFLLGSVEGDLIWRQGLYGDREAEMRSSELIPVQSEWRPCEKGKFRHG